ncbi:MAG TPA: AI-2E family transporter [Candidatus Scatomorpha intestinavium]|uniref:AI-2E family transporter n=1 Tax=Candidatus Scatomorpha intestinavium TaxID=2840922 RepID=A0A9D0ZGI4_9FIRM|nr:AI-2E family transporter [Candidatus Scatomorpha intestinavium]
MKLDRRTVRTILLIITFAVALYTAAQNLGALYGAVRTVWDVFNVVITGLALAFVLNVPLKLFENRLFYGMSEDRRALVRRLRRPLSIICALLITLGVVVILFAVLLPRLIDTVAVVAESLPAYIEQFVAWVEGLLARFNFESGDLFNLSIDWSAAVEQFFSGLTDRMGDIIGTATNVGTSVVGALVDGLFSLVIAVYVLAEKEQICAFARRVITNFLPERASGGLVTIANMASETFTNFIAGQLMDSLILGVLCYIGMKIFRFPHAEVISVVIGVTSLVPLVGSFIGEIIGAFLILIASPLKALLFMVFILCLQQVEGSFIYPKVVGKSVGLPGVAVFSAVLVGGNIAGVTGALLGAPICAMFYAILQQALASREARRAAGKP